MKNDTRVEVIAFIKERVTDFDDLVDLLVGLEYAYDVRTSVVTRNDVESEFEEAWLFESEENRKMTDEEWEKFCSEWFWRKGHSEVLWDGVIDAIRWDLREANLMPNGAVVE